MPATRTNSAAAVETKRLPFFIEPSYLPETIVAEWRERSDVVQKFGAYRGPTMPTPTLESGLVESCATLS